MTHLTIVTGCAGSGKSERLLEAYRAALDQARDERRPGSALWLTPTRRIQRAVEQELVARCGRACFAINVLTFDLFAEKILHAAGRPASPMSPVMKRLLLRRITRTLLDQGELRHFEPIAATTGFLDVVSSFISELKREEVWPEQFVAACQDRKSAFARRDLELGLIYARYQQHLTEQSWYDNEGRFWLARNELGNKVRGPFADVRFLAVDGFADFTQTQYEILGYLSAWIENVSISLPLEDPVTRSDLFSKPQAATMRIREHLPEEVVCHIERLPSESTREGTGVSRSVRYGWAQSLGVVADRLFSNPRSGMATSAAAHLEIIQSTGPMGEWEAVARRIKSMLVHGTELETTAPVEGMTSKRIRPQQIVIGLRSITDDGPRLRDFLTAAGLPVWCEAEMPLTSSPMVKAITALLQFELEDWPFERLVGLLDSTFFRPDWPELNLPRAIRATAAALRQLRIHSGRDLVLRVLSRYANDATTPEAASKQTSLVAWSRLASPLLSRLNRALDRLRRSHTLADWADVLAAISDEFGWTSPAATRGNPTDSVEGRDLDLVQRILRTAAEADQKISGTDRPRKLTLSEFHAELRDLLSHETLKATAEPGGCIRILSVEQIRNLEVPHLFLMGLTENSFPMNRADDCLFTEFERQDFISRGIALRHRSAQHADEMFLFYSVVTRARHSLTLSYPSVNAKGQPVFPSPYVTALTSLFIPGYVKNSHEGKLDPVPDMEDALTPTDLRLASMVEALDGRPGLFRAMLEQDSTRRACWNTLAACEVADHRFHQRGFTRYEGRLELSQNTDHLRQRFGSHHQFSATELEAYARCPFQFWLSNVLRIGAVESPEEGTDYAGRGNLLHEVAARLLNEGTLGDAAGLGPRFRELVHEQLDRRFPETELQKALVKIERMILSEWADAFVNQQGEYEQNAGDQLKTLRSLEPEIPFGSLPDAPMAARVVHPPIQFGSEDRSVKIRGRIDRVDVGSFEGHPAYVVLDYKTGQRPPLKDQDLVSGRTIQLALYLIAIKRLGLVGPDAVPFQMGYWALRETGFKPVLTRSKFTQLPEGTIPWMEAVFDELLPQLAEEIRSGRFVVENSDPDCTGRCPYRTVCRVNQLRPVAAVLGKQSPERVDPKNAIEKPA